MVTLERQSNGDKLGPGQVGGNSDSNNFNSKDSHPIEKTLHRYFTPSMFVLFFVALSVRLFFNFSTTHDNCAFVGDANEYLREAIVLSQPIYRSQDFLKDAQAVIFNQATPEVLANMKVNTSLMIEMHRAGPLYPLVIVGFYALFGHTPNLTDWWTPIACNSILSAFICVFCALTTKNLWNARAGILAGVLAAVQPGLIASSGTLYSETFTALCLIYICWGVSQSVAESKPGSVVSFFMGLSMGALWLTRPPAMVLMGLLIPFLAFARFKKKALLAIATFLLGFALIIAPYCAFQKVAFNKVTGFVERSANYNLVMGNNYGTLGWLAYPYPNVAQAWDGGAKYVVKYALQHPDLSFNLQVDKVLRLVKFPFNDYRTPIGPLKFADQALLHQIMLLFAGIGLCLGFFGDIRSRAGVRREVARFSVLIVGLTGFAYLAFIAMGRYFVPSLPVLVILSAVGMVNLSSMLLRFKSVSFAITTVFCLIALMLIVEANLIPVLIENGITHNSSAAFILSMAIKSIPVVCLGVLLLSLQLFGNWGASSGATDSRKQALYWRFHLGWTALIILVSLPLITFPARASGRRFESSILLDKPGQIISQEIDFVKDKPVAAIANNSDMYLMIDVADSGSLSGLSLRVNGIKTSTVRIPGFSVVPDYSSYRSVSGGNVTFEAEHIYDCLSLPAGVGNADVRQWYIVPLDATTAQSIRQKGVAKIEIEKTNFTPSTLFGEFAFRRNSYALPAAALYSWEKNFYAVENPAGLADPRYEDRLHREHTMLLDGEKMPGNPEVANVRLVVTPHALQPGTEKNSQRNWVSSKLPDAIGGTYQTVVGQIDGDLPECSSKQFWLVTVSGKVKAVVGNPKPHTMVTVFCDSGDSSKSKNCARLTYVSPWSPKTLANVDNVKDSQWNDFTFSLPLYAGNFPGKVRKIVFTTTEGDTREWVVNADASEKPSQFALSDVRIDVSVLPNRPLSEGFVAF